ncbi:MAG: hypothetical protein ABJA61_05320 [Caldimonas sp.]
MSFARPAKLQLAACACALAVAMGDAAAQAKECASEPELSTLDFWVGNWQVCAQGERAGSDRVSKILHGCAVGEEWTASDGSRGQGLFYYDVQAKLWKQVWLTDDALRPGGQKEKHLVARYPDGGVRFEGEIALADGRRILDRTTLRPGAQGTVMQRIEISRDGGDTWTSTFDAVYRPMSADAASCR